jgi:hypothetical protein
VRRLCQQLKDGIVAQQARIVGIFVAGDDLIEALRQQGWRSVLQRFWQPGVAQRRRPSTGQAITLIKLTQRQQTSVGTDLPAIKLRSDRPIPIEGKLELCLNTVCHLGILQKRVLGSQKTQCFSALLEHPYFLQAKYLNNPRGGLGMVEIGIPSIVGATRG